MKQPTGYIAECQCGRVVGVLDYQRTGRKESGQIIGQWLHNGCTVRPMFGGSWSATIESCKCVKDGE